MTKRKTAPAAERAGAPAFDIDGLLAMNMRIYQNMMRVHTELLDFTNRRLRADIEVAQKLTGGGKLDDAVEAVYGFQRQIISDYKPSWWTAPHTKRKFTHPIPGSSKTKRARSTAMAVPPMAATLPRPARRHHRWVNGARATRPM